MTKKELIRAIKNEIKDISSILKKNKSNFKQNQRTYQKAPLVNSRYGKIKSIISSDYKKIECYPFSRPYDAIEIDGKFYFKGNYWEFNPDIYTAKCHLTRLHILYNKLRNKKQHCNSIERETYYVKWYKDYFEGMESKLQETENDVVS